MNIRSFGVAAVMVCSPLVFGQTAPTASQQAVGAPDEGWLNLAPYLWFAGDAWNRWRARP